MMKTDFRRSQRDCVYCALHINSALSISHYHQLENVCQLNMHDINRTRQHHSLSNKIKGCVNVGHYTYFETHHPNDCARALTYERFLTSKSFKWINAEWAFFFHSLSISLYLQRKKEYAQQKNLIKIANNGRICCLAICLYIFVSCIQDSFASVSVSVFLLTSFLLIIRFFLCAERLFHWKYVLFDQMNNSKAIKNYAKYN